MTAEFTCRAMAASVADNTIIASKCFVTNYIQNAEIICQFPSLSLIEPHQRRVYHELM